MLPTFRRTGASWFSNTVHGLALLTTSTVWMKRQKGNVTAEMQIGRVSPACLSTHSAMRSLSFAVPGLRRRLDFGLGIWDREATSSDSRSRERISNGVRDHLSGHTAIDFRRGDAVTHKYRG